LWLSDKGQPYNYQAVIAELKKAGASIRAIARQLKVSVGVVHKTLSIPTPEVAVKMEGPAG
jgi:lambda repressor-like predicted transcriptional regulator